MTQSVYPIILMKMDSGNPLHTIRKQRKEFNKSVKWQAISGCSKGQSEVKGALDLA